MTSHHQRAAEIVPEWDTFRDSLPEGDACDCGKWRLCKHDDDKRIYQIRVAVAAALADVEREAMEKCLEILKGYFSLCHCDEAWTSRDRHAPECTVEEMEDAVAAIRAAFATDERET